MIHTYLVTVETDDRHMDAPTHTGIANEIRMTLQYDVPSNGVEHISVRHLDSYLGGVICGQIEEDYR